MTYLRPPYTSVDSVHGPATVYDAPLPGKESPVGWVLRVKESLPYKGELAALLCRLLNQAAAEHAHFRVPHLPDTGAPCGLCGVPGAHYAVTVGDVVAGGEVVVVCDDSAACRRRAIAKVRRLEAVLYPVAAP